jgi:hypothetical protein
MAWSAYVPGSLGKPAAVAAIVPAACVLFVTIEVTAVSWMLPVAFVIFFGVPLAGSSLVTAWLGRRRPVVAGVTMLVTFAVQAGFGALVGGSSYAVMGAEIGALCTLAAAVAFVPVFGATAVLATKRDLEAGDVLLAWFAAWFGAIHLLAVILPDLWGAEWYHALPGLVASVAAIALAFARSHRRRAWCAAVERGSVDGWRTRPDPTDEELVGLPPLYGSAFEAANVIERWERVPTAYRDAPVAIPVALAPRTS